MAVAAAAANIAHETRRISLDNVPDEILEHIAFFSGTSPLLGPPSTIATLLTLNRKINSVLSPSRNPHVYARIFAAKFDTSALFRRFGVSEISAQTLATLLKNRCTVLKRIRAKTDCLRTRPAELDVDESARWTKKEEEGFLDRILATCFTMMLENDRKNEEQLRHAGLKEWLDAYWFDSDGASFAIMALRASRWPVSDDRLALGMWLFWFMLNPMAKEQIIYDTMKMRTVMSVLKPFALAAHKYPLTRYPWPALHPHRTFSKSSSSHFLSPHLEGLSTHAVSISDTSRLSPLPLSVPATLCYFNLASTRIGGNDPYELLGVQFSRALAENRTCGWGATPSPAFLPRAVVHPKVPNSVRWDCEWERCTMRDDEGDADVDLGMTVENGEGEVMVTRGVKARGSGTYRAFRPGCLEGVWEGLFTYTEFSTYAALLEGASPSALQGSQIAQHRQTWKLREYHLLAEAPPFTAPGEMGMPSFSRSADNGRTEVLSSASASASAEGSSATPCAVPAGSSLPFTPSPSSSSSTPLPPGDPLRGYIPPNATFTETPSGLDVQLPATEAHLIRTLHYTHFTPELVEAHERASAEGGVEYASRVRDILLRGEGHSTWGEFSLVGRVRPCDGFVNVSKEYVNGDRGRWLYQGYLVGVGTFNGEQVGHMVGRWRDTLTPVEIPGYEGCFGMIRRQ